MYAKTRPRPDAIPDVIPGIYHPPSVQAWGIETTKKKRRERKNEMDTPPQVSHRDISATPKGNVSNNQGMLDVRKYPLQA